MGTWGGEVGLEETYITTTKKKKKKHLKDSIRQLQKERKILKYYFLLLKVVDAVHDDFSTPILLYLVAVS